MLFPEEVRTVLLSADPLTERPVTDTPDWAVFKERPKRRATLSDRWSNSGGMKGGRDLPFDSVCPFVRRRYGTVSGKHYYEYTLLHKRSSCIFEDKSATLFHILPTPPVLGDGRRAERVVQAGEQPVSVDRTAATASVVQRQPCSVGRKRAPQLLNATEAAIVNATAAAAGVQALQVARG
jgi:hypothetical protein